jgi:adenylylsulfate kinase-like enzyme
MRPTAGFSSLAAAGSAHERAVPALGPAARAPRAPADLLRALARVAGRATDVDVERCRRALEPALDAFNGGEDPLHADVRSARDDADGPGLARGRALLGQAVRDALRRLTRRRGTPLQNPRPCRLVDAQLLLYHAMAAAGLARVDESSVPRGAPYSAAPTSGTVFWLTGLSGAGKSTLAAAVAARLRQYGARPSLLDGDDLRMPIAGPTAEEHLPTEFSSAARRRLAFRYAELARLTAAAGYDVVCATVSAFHEVRAENRRRIARYVEVWVDAPMDVLRARDPKGLYARAWRGEVTDVVGVDLPFEAPSDADHVVHNVGGRRDLRRAARAIVDAWREAPPRVGTADDSLPNERVGRSFP